MTERAVMTERGLTVITVIWGQAIVANANNAIVADYRANLQLGEVLGGVILDPTGAAAVALTATRGVTPGAVPAGQVQLNDGTHFESGTATSAATDLTVLQCRAGYSSANEPGANTERAAMTEKSLALFTIIWTGIAIVLNTSTAIPSAYRGGLDIGAIITAYYFPNTGAVTPMTVVVPGTGAPGANSIRLDNANINQIILDKAGGNLLLTDTLVMHCQAGPAIGPRVESPKITEKGLAEFVVVFSGGATGAASTAIASAMRAGLQLFEILTAYIHDRAAGGITALTPTRITPAAANEIQLDTSGSFIRGTGTPAHDIPADDQVIMHVRADVWA